jgi:uncharacterized cupredoxin-like copper-binding protein
MKKMIGFLLLVTIALMTTACSANSGPEPLELTIELSEFAFSPQDLEFQVGQEVTLHLVNVGALGHEIMFGREVEMEDGQPHGYHMDMFEFAGIEPEVTKMEGEHSDDEEMHMEEGEEEHEHSGFMVEVPPGDDEYTMKFTVTEDMVGEWEIGCFDQNGVHYTAGMVGSLTVIP